MPSRQPATTAELLRLLGVQGTSVEYHRPLLRRWLAQNKPSKELGISLRANGYGLLLPPPRRESRPPLAHRAS